MAADARLLLQLEVPTVHLELLGVVVVALQKGDFVLGRGGERSCQQERDCDC